MGRFLQPQRGGCGEQGSQQGRVNLGIWGELQGEIRKRFGVSLVLRGVTKAPAGWVSKAPTLASAHYSKEIPWSNILERRKAEHHPQHTHWPPAEESCARTGSPPSLGTLGLPSPRVYVPDWYQEET